MDRTQSLGGALIGLLLGAVAGTGVFALTGSLDLQKGFISLMIMAVAGAVVGWQASKVIMWFKSRDRHPSTDQSSNKISVSNFPIVVQEPHIPVQSQRFGVDASRLGVLTMWFILLGAGFIYLGGNTGLQPIQLVISLPLYSFLLLSITPRHGSST